MLEHRVKSPSIKLLLQETDEDTTLTVQDNGPGFPDMDIGQLLEPYVTTRQKGTGLGLAIVNKIMDDHAGRMELGKANGAVPASNFRLNAHNQVGHRSWRQIF